MTNPYEDIITLPHHVSSRRKRMTLEDRAAQFAPFAALTGFDVSVSEAGRLTDFQTEPGEDTYRLLDQIHRGLLEKEAHHPEIAVNYFVPDSRKDGGHYVQITGRLKHTDLHTRTLILVDGTSIPMDAITNILDYANDADDMQIACCDFE